MTPDNPPSRHIDIFIWLPIVFTGNLLVISVSLFLVIQLNYWNNKLPLQRELMAQAEINLLELPAEALVWRLPADSLGSPLDEYIRVQWDYRSFEPDYLSFKLRSVPLPQGIEGPRLLVQAARRPLHESSLQEELLLRPYDIADCAAVLMRQMASLRLPSPAHADLHFEVAADIERAEQLIRAYYTTGLYLATRRFRLDCVRVGIMMMIHSAEHLRNFSIAQQRQEEANRLATLIEELHPLSDRIQLITSYTSDDGHLEIWVTMLEQSRSPAVKLHAAGLLARTASLWWRYAESSRAIHVLRQSVANNHNHSIRSVLFDLVQAVEHGHPIPADFSDLSFDDRSGIMYLLDLIF